jgi:hypothetical protein
LERKGKVEKGTVNKDDTSSYVRHGVLDTQEQACQTRLVIRATLRVELTEGAKLTKIFSTY